MTTLSPGRTRLALLALAIGGFGIGATEFVAMGLLPDIARDLLPTLYAARQEDALAQTGAMISAYAAGVVVGAPTIAALAARFPRRALLVGLVLAFTIGSVLSAVAPTFELVVAARFVAALPHGAYFGVAALVAADLMGPGNRGRGVAFVLSGLTIANIIGVPLITLLGQNAGWRAAYLAVAGIFALAFVAILAFVPASPGDPAATFRRELRVFRRIGVWFALLTGAIGFGGFFAVYSYVAPLATEVTGLEPGAVPFILAAMGVGMTIGNLIGGRLADRGAVRGIYVSFAAFAVSLTLLGLTATNVVGLVAGLVLVTGASAALSPVIQTRLMDVAGDSQTLAAAINHSALNIGNSLGAYLGGVVIAAGFGFISPTWVGLLLCVPGVGFAIAGALVSRRYLTETGSIRRPDEGVTPIDG